MAERKQIFARYVEQQREAEREERRERDLRARDEFTRLLREHPGIRSDMRWGEAIGLLRDEPAFKAIENPRERADLYEAFIEHLRRHDSVPPASQWGRAQPKLTNSC